jgi:superkiller protein 3
MSTDPIPEEPTSVSANAAPDPEGEAAVREEPAALEPRAAGSRSTKQRAMAIAVVLAILAAPIGYLVLHRSPRQVSAAMEVAQPAAVPSIPQLEAIERGSPTVANRISLSVGYINGNQPARAIPILNSIVAADGKNAIAWNNLCVAHTMQMEYKAAIEECDNALRFAPGFQLAQNNLKWAQDEKQKAIAAITAQEQIAPASRNADSYLAEGLDNLHIGNYDQAIKAWQRALEINPRNSLAANNIGIAYMAKKQPATAIPWFEKAIAMDSNLQIARNNLAWAKDEEKKSAK